MNRILDIGKIEESLSLLAELLARRKGNSYRLIACGGSALLVTGIKRETTKDVDILAGLREDNTIEQFSDLPWELQTAVRDVASEMNLDENWLNTGPSSMLNVKQNNFGLPEGFTERLFEKKYGKKLTIFYIGHRDQIFFKLYAVVDKCGPSYHFDDLITLKPNEEELLAACRWAMVQDPSNGFADTLKDMLEKTGYDSIITKL